MSSPNSIFDSTTSEAVGEFSRKLEDLIATSGVTANVLYVILHFHANQMMAQITEAATKRVVTRESEVDDMLREDMKRTGELPE